MSSSHAQNITLRPITATDEPFLFTLYASTRADEMALWPWNAAQKAAFLQMQFAAQSAAYHQHYAQATFSLVCLAGEPIGRLYVDWQAQAIHVIDIALLPAYRQRGIGTHLLSELLAAGANQQCPVRLQVAVDNPAQQLYHRLGFVPSGKPEVYLAMEWRPAPPIPAA